MPTISVVIPALNDAPLLEQCLRALAHQTRLADEIIVVDNGSDDNTADVATQFGCRVVYEPVRGIPSATARGFDEATMDILARLDADSLPREDWLELVEAHFAQDERLTAVTGTGEFYGSKKWVHWAGQKFYLGGYFWFFPFVLGHSPVFGSNCAIRKSAWVELEPQFLRTTPKVHDDLHLSMLMTPEMTVRFDRNLRVGVSARPLVSVKRLARGAWWAIPTTRATMVDQSLIARRRQRMQHVKQKASV